MYYFLRYLKFRLFFYGAGFIKWGCLKKLIFNKLMCCFLLIITKNNTIFGGCLKNFKFLNSPIFKKYFLTK